MLNSTVNKEAAFDALKTYQNKVYLALDNDRGGDDTTAWLMQHLPSAIDIRDRFAPAKDVNEYLIKLKSGNCQESPTLSRFYIKP